jgi:hypothetical protein
MPLRAWCNGCNSFVLLTADGACPNGHGKPMLRGIEEVRDGTRVAAPRPVPQPSPIAVQPMAPAGPTVPDTPPPPDTDAPSGAPGPDLGGSSFLPPPAPATQATASASPWESQPLPESKPRTIPWWVFAVAAVALIVGGYFGVRWLMRGNGGTFQTQMTLIVTVPKGWEVHRDNYGGFAVSPVDAPNDVELTLTGLHDQSGQAGGDLVTLERANEENSGVHVDEVDWIGFRGIRYTVPADIGGQTIHTSVWNHQHTTYQAFYWGQGPAFAKYQAQADTILASVKERP